LLTNNQQTAMILQVKDQLERLHQLIESGSTGSPAELAQRLGVTDRTVRNYISQLGKPSSLTLS
jgi:transcriptional antiterminator